MSFLTVVLIAIGGAFLVEGAAWAVFPQQIKRAYEIVFRGGNREIHVFGLINVAIGTAIIGLALKFTGA